MDAHFKSVEKVASASGGKVDPFVGLSSTGIAGTGSEKEEENVQSNEKPTEEARKDETGKKYTKYTYQYDHFGSLENI